MYDNVKSIRLVKETANLTIVNAMVSTEGELLEFRTNGKEFSPFYY